MIGRIACVDVEAEAAEITRQPSCVGGQAWLDDMQDSQVEAGGVADILV